jgi:hypothetical protein
MLQKIRGEAATKTADAVHIHHKPPLPHADLFASDRTQALTPTSLPKLLAVARWEWVVNHPATTAAHMYVGRAPTGPPLPRPHNVEPPLCTQYQLHSRHPCHARAISPTHLCMSQDLSFGTQVQPLNPWSTIRVLWLVRKSYHT